MREGGEGGGRRVRGERWKFVFAASQEHHLLVANLADLKEAAAGADVAVADLVGSVADVGATGAVHMHTRESQSS